MIPEVKRYAKPFVKWAGGKTQLLGEIEKSLPDNFASIEDVVYVEPFVGGGAVLFWLLQRYSNISRAIINDINSDLINVYSVVKVSPDKLVRELQQLESAYIRLGAQERKDYYAEQRSLFNEKSASKEVMAALFVFLNRTCFNGLYRVNAKGAFNVPHGKYANPKICDERNIWAVSELLQRVEILCGDFSKTLEYASNKSLFYIDPPYKPLTETSSFTSYAKEGFNDEEQIRLGRFCMEISKRRAMFVASNSDPQEMNPQDDFFYRVYDTFNIRKVQASRMINANPSGRGKLFEIMITNIDR
ncbi:DNA adenine methylase [uncultured Alistipes sp.]|uniref:DNA adenine methylase n=1 Tax=uncultured Alistipes sp. TaxID=538949 RepID=UPI00265F0B12|nr:DNA adenine methylase [uncultured Alistipes sp.]